VDLGIAREGAGGLRHHERRAAHGLDAAGHNDLSFACLDGTRSRNHGIHAGAAKAVHRSAWNFDRKASKQKRHARHVAVVFAGLVGATENDFIKRRPIDVWIALHKRSKRDSTQVIGTYRRKRATKAPDRRTYVITDKCLSHVLYPRI